MLGEPCQVVLDRKAGEPSVSMWWSYRQYVSRPSFFAS
jgi:hypothetical protein